MPAKKKREKVEQELKELIASGWHKNYKDDLLNCVSQTADPFGLLVYMVGRSDKFSHHSSWALGNYGILHLGETTPYLKELIAIVNKTEEKDGIRKDVLRVLALHDFSEELEGEMLDLAFSLLLDPSKTRAVHYFSIEIAFKIVRKYPDLRGEYDSVIAETKTWASDPFKAKAAKLAHKLDKAK